MKILIIDDSDAMRMVIKRVLNSFQWRIEVCEARDGRHAIDVYQKERPQLIITDWNMPSIDGLTLINAFKRNNIQVPIGMITGNGSDAEVDRVKAAGAAFVITKPFLPATLRDALEPLVGSNATTRAIPATSRPKLVKPLIDEMINGLKTALKRDLVSVEGQGTSIDGSTGVVFSIVDNTKRAVAVMAFDWHLTNFLAAAMAGNLVGDPHRNLQHRRVTPQVHDTIMEIANLTRGVLRNIRSGEYVDVDLMAFRGDGVLRSEPWQELFALPAFKTAKQSHRLIKVSGLGEGQSTLFELSEQ